MKAVRELGSERRETVRVHIRRGRWSIESDLSLVREDRERCTASVPVIVPSVRAG